MTRHTEASVEEKAQRKATRVANAVDGGLERAVQRAGGDLLGLSVKLNPVECLLVIKAEFPAGRMVAFCASSDLASALIKAVHEAANDRLRWREDRYAAPS
jgi:hypothetical protein